MSQSKPLSPWHSYALRRAHPGQPIVGSYGGHPRGIQAHIWPRCAVCGAPMCHMAQIDSGPWLDLQGYARVSLFICHATGGRCEDWDPWKGANRVILQVKRDDGLYDGPPTVRVYRRTRLSVEQPFDERAFMKQIKEQGRPMTEAVARLHHDKLGGGAVWLHGDDTPKSVTGSGMMRLALQLTTDLVSFDITPGGMGYLFLDPNDRTEGAARFLWQSG